VSRSAPLLLAVDCVEKVLSGVGTSFLRAVVSFAFWDVGDRFDLADSFSGLPTYSGRASPAEVGDQLAFARILLTQHFRLFQHNPFSCAI
jgi:hypothetical protein